MSTTKHALDELDITNEELHRFTKAFKNDEFKKLFAEYCEEISDPENIRLYESELTQLEAERGIDITFLHPQPGYVLKTTTNGDLKTFINVSKCDKIGKPSSTYGLNPENGEKGLNWSLPYAQSAVRRDYDKNKKLCAVYDVVFHPDTIHLAQKNAAFRQLVTSTALDAVAKANDITLDTVNVKTPNITFKGTARPTAIRKKSGKPLAPENLEPSPIDHIYPPLLEETLKARAQPKVSKDIQNETTKQSSAVKQYTTPKYSVCQRKHVEYSEMTNELDAKLNSTIPSELVVTVELPLLRNISDTTLDVTAEELYLVSEVPAKYKLKLKLPYKVEESRGTAKFDQSKRRLVVTLPVLRKKCLTIDDITNRHKFVEEEFNNSNNDNELKLVEEVNNGDFIEKGHPMNGNCIESPVDVTLVPATKEPTPRGGFLDPTVLYEFPSYTCETLSTTTISFTINVGNVDPTSVAIDEQPHNVHLKFMSIGTGCFPQYFAFYVEFPNEIGSILTAQPDVWDNNLILQIDVPKTTFEYYKTGVDAEHLTVCPAPNNTNNIIVENKPSKLKFETEIIGTLSDDDVIETIPLETLTIKQKGNEEKSSEKKTTTKKAAKDKRRSYSESNCDDFKDDASNVVDNQSKSIAVPKSPMKQRTYSECSSLDEHGEPQKCLKSILKRRSSSSWSISESSFEDNPISRSVDFTENSIPEEHMEEHCKKSVRFDNNIRKFLFRTNSTIVGQRKPKPNKHKKKKKRTTERRYSEGEASDYDPKHSSSEGECNAGQTPRPGKQLAVNAMHDSGVDLSDHDRDMRGNNNNINAATKHGADLKFKSDMIFDIDM